MMETSRNRNLDLGLFALAFGLALAIRLLRLGELPLTDDEARWAMQAFELTKGLKPVIGPQPGYVLLTALAFFGFQASNFAARLVPALFGAGLTLVPFYFRDRLGGKPAIVLAFLLAFDPGFLALSRLAGSPIIAVAAVLFAWGLWRAGNAKAAGIWAGVALLGGPQLFAGILGLAVANGLLRGFFVKEKEAELVKPVPFERQSAIIFAAFAAGTYILLGSFFLLATGGLSAGLAAIPAYFGGWLDFTDVPAWRLLLGLASYELFALLLAIVGLVRGIIKRDEMTISLGIWLTVALVLALAYPFRQVSDLVWVLVPLLVLAAIEASNYIVPIQDGNWETLGMTAFTIAILTFVALNYSAIAQVSMEQTALQLRWGVLLGSLVLLALSIVMVGYGWSVQVAIQGSLWGALTVLAVYSLSTALAAGCLRIYRTIEMWPAGPYIKQAEPLISQLNEFSRAKAGVNASLDITLAGVDSPALRWVLRDWPVSLAPGLVLSGTPSIVIATDQFTNTDIESAYRGQDFIWRTYPAWNTGLPNDWLRWSILHEFPQGEEKIILWTRSDVFIDSQNNK